MQITHEVAEVHRRFKLKEQLTDFFALESYEIPFYLSKAKMQIVHAGNRGGKTQTAAKKFCDVMTHRHPTIKRDGPQQGRIVAESYKIMKKAIIPLLRQFIPKTWLLGKDFDDSFNLQDGMIYLKDGGTIQLMTYEQKIDAFRSVPLDIIWNDEQGPVEIFDENMSRLGDKAGLCMNTLTPEKGANYLHQRYTCRAHPGSDIEYFHFDVLQNPHIDREFQIRSLALMPPRKRRIKLFGDVIAMQGLVYEEFDPKVHTVAPFLIPKRWQLFVGVDLGWANPTAVLYIAVSPLNELFVIEEQYETRELIATTAKKICETIEQRYQHLTFRFAVVDARSANITSRQTGESDLKKFVRNFHIGSVKLSSCKDNAVMNRVNRVHELLMVNPETKHSALKFFKTCIHTIDEFGNYVMREQKLDSDGNINEKPLDKHDHCMSALGMVAENRLSFADFTRNFSSVELKSAYPCGGII
jgi:phage terminase large subunit-like protein